MTGAFEYGKNWTADPNDYVEKRIEQGFDSEDISFDKHVDEQFTAIHGIALAQEQDNAA